MTFEIQCSAANRRALSGRADAKIKQQFFEALAAPIILLLDIFPYARPAGMRTTNDE